MKFSQEKVLGNMDTVQLNMIQGFCKLSVGLFSAFSKDSGLGQVSKEANGDKKAELVKLSEVLEKIKDGKACEMTLRKSRCL